MIDPQSCLERLLKSSQFSSRMILNLVNDLLDLAKMENATFNLNTEYFNLFEVIDKAIENINFQAKLKEVSM